MRPSGWRGIEEARLELDPDDPRDCVVETAHWDESGMHIRNRRCDEILPVVRHHDEVDACVDGLGAVPLAAARYLLDAVPVAHDQAVKSEPLLQHVAYQIGVSVHLAPGLARRRVGK